MQAHGGGAGAPDLGGLVFARGVCGVSGRRPDQRRERQSRRRPRRSYPIFEGVTLDLPNFFSLSARERVTLSFFHMRERVTLDLPYLFRHVQPRELPYLSVCVAECYPIFFLCAQESYPILFLYVWHGVTLTFAMCTERTYPIFLMCVT